MDGPRRTPQKVVIQVKGGRVSSSQIRDLRGVVEREKAALGLFIFLDDPTRDMRSEEAGGGFYHSELWQRDFPKIQLRTIADLLVLQPQIISGRFRNARAHWTSNYRLRAWHKALQS